MWRFWVPLLVSLSVAQSFQVVPSTLNRTITPPANFTLGDDLVSAATSTEGCDATQGQAMDQVTGNMCLCDSGYWMQEMQSQIFYWSYYTTCVPVGKIAGFVDRYYGPALQLFDCMACGTGNFNPSCSVACSGTGCVLANYGSCVVCPAGYSCTGPIETMCEPGYYSPEGSLVCTPCPSGAMSDYGFASCYCGSGTGPGAGGACVACAPGTASEFGAACVACGSGTYSSPEGIHCLSCTVCDPGTFRSQACGLASDTVCNACAAGTYSATGSANACGVCAAGKYSDPGATACVDCVAGTYSSSTGSTGCVACSAGNYSFDAATRCYPCTTCVAPYSQVSECTPSSDSICSLLGKPCDSDPATVLIPWTQTPTIINLTYGAPLVATCDPVYSRRCRGWVGEGQGYYGTAGSCRNCTIGALEPTCGWGMFGNITGCSSTLDSPCVPCVGTKPPNAVWTRPISPFYHSNTSSNTCEWVCDVGYYPLGNGSCGKCFVPVNGTAVAGNIYPNNAVTLNSTTDPVLFGGDSVSQCRIRCANGFVFNSNSVGNTNPIPSNYQCVNCKKDVCLPGKFIQTDAISGCDDCVACTAVPNSVFTSGCTFVCNSGYYKSGSSCVLCSNPTCTTGQYKQACTATTNTLCKTCTASCPAAQRTLTACTSTADRTCEPCPVTTLVNGAIGPECVAGCIPNYALVGGVCTACATQAYQCAANYKLGACNATYLGCEPCPMPVNPPPNWCWTGSPSGSCNTAAYTVASCIIVGSTTPVPTTSTAGPTTSSTTPVPTTSSTTPAPTTSSTTPVPTTSSTTPAPTTSSTTPAPTTSSTTPAPTTSSTTPAPTTSSTTPTPTTSSTTPTPTTSSTTPTPTTSSTTPTPTTSSTTRAPTSSSTTPMLTTSVVPTTSSTSQASTTSQALATSSTSQAPTTSSTSQAPTTTVRTDTSSQVTTRTSTTTRAATTQAATTRTTTTQAPTQAATTQAPTQAATTQAPTQAATTQAATTQAPTQAATTRAATTQAATTQAATTQTATTQAPTTQAATTQAPTTKAATTPITQTTTTLPVPSTTRSSTRTSTSVVTTPVPTTTAAPEVPVSLSALTVSNVTVTTALCASNATAAQLSLKYNSTVGIVAVTSPDGVVTDCPSFVCPCASRRLLQSGGVVVYSYQYQSLAQPTIEQLQAAIATVIPTANVVTITLVATAPPTPENLVYKPISVWTAVAAQSSSLMVVVVVVVVVLFAGVAIGLLCARQDTLQGPVIPIKVDKKL